MIRSSFTAFLLVAATVLVYSNSASAGELEPSAPPAPTMTTLDQIRSILQAPASSEFQFLGTTVLTTADSGLLAMTRACPASFGAGTRMCTSLEIINTLQLPVAGDWNSNIAWVRAEIVSSYGAGSAYGALVDATGLTIFGQNRLDLSCLGWSTVVGGSDTKGLTIANGADHEGRFAVSPCETQAGVACCGHVSP